MQGAEGAEEGTEHESSRKTTCFVSFFEIPCLLGDLRMKDNTKSGMLHTCSLKPQAAAIIIYYDDHKTLEESLTT